MRTFGNKRPIRDDSGKIIELVDSPVCAVTYNELGGAFGRDKRHRLVVTLAAGDVITMRPSQTRRAVSGTAQDIYRYLLTCAAGTFQRKVNEYKKTMTLKQARRKARKELGL